MVVPLTVALNINSVGRWAVDRGRFGAKPSARKMSVNLQLLAEVPKCVLILWSDSDTFYCNCIFVLKEITLKMVKLLAETCYLLTYLLTYSMEQSPS